MAVVFVVGVVYWWQSGLEQQSEQTRYITETVSKGTLTSFVLASGNVIVDQQSTVDPTITGTVADLSVKVGDSISKGQLLFTIINDDLGISVSKADASYESAKNSVQSAKIDEDSAEATYEKAKDEDEDDGDAYTKRELRVLKDKIALARAKVIQSEKNASAILAEYKNTVSDAAKRKVTAPIAGTVNEINIKNGDDLGRLSGNNNSSAPIIIGDLGTLKASVDVNEVDVPRVSVGQKAVLNIDALDDMSFSGTVEKISALGTVSQGVVTYTVTIGFDVLDTKIKPQMSVSASITTDVKSDVIIVPSGSVKNDGVPYVDVLINGLSERRNVQTGVNNGISVEVMNGLQIGDRVITQTVEPGNTASSQSGGGSANGLRIPGLTGGTGTRNFR